MSKHYVLKLYLVLHEEQYIADQYTISNLI